MSPPVSDLFVVRETAGAGRGVFAICEIPQDTLILRSSPPAAHVLFRDYRKEVCAQCFYYNLGRVLPVRDNTVGKVFCSDVCREEWSDEQGVAGITAWQAVNAMALSRGGQDLNMLNGSDSMVDAGCMRPNQSEIEAAWASAEALVTEKTKRHTKKPQLLPYQADINHVGYFLDGAIARQRDGASWQRRVECLVVDHEPYSDYAELHSYCEAYRQLAPAAGSLSISANTCRLLVAVGSQNAFGIRGGSEDAEEYMGYGVYPESSYFNHSCSPNVSKRRVGRVWEFRAARDIHIDEECCISYLGGEERSLNVDQRRKRLETVWRFECKCEKCSNEIRQHTLE